MANPEHVDKLAEGVEEWNTWRKLSDTIPDLIGADLSDRNLVGVDFSRALLDGADFRRSDLRGAVLTNASILSADLSQADLGRADCSDANLEGASLIGTTLARIKATRTNLTHTEISDCDVSESDCESAVLNYATLTRVSLSGAMLNRVQLIEAVLQDCQLGDSHLVSANFSTAKLRSCNFDKATLSNATVTRTSFDSCSLRQTIMDGAHLEDASFSEVDATAIDLSGAVLIRLSLKALNLCSATLFDTRIINPIWPIKPVGTTWAGVPVLDPTLFSHPVQDVKGLSPEIRRRVADAQLVREYWERSCDSAVKRFGMRLWGISCNYGQSPLRWIICALCALTICAVILKSTPFYIPVYDERSTPAELEPPANRSQQAPDTKSNHQVEKTARQSLITVPRNKEVTQHLVVAKPTLFRALCFSAVIFTSLGFSDMTPASSLGQVMIVVLVVTGYAMLGGLISIFATKLARLS
jgi:uncharacterized protein YjbI with pentapeptide repeats